MKCYYCKLEMLDIGDHQTFDKGLCVKHKFPVHQTEDLDGNVLGIQFSPMLETVKSKKEEMIIYINFVANKTGIYFERRKVTVDGILNLTPENASSKLKMYATFE